MIRGFTVSKGECLADLQGVGVSSETRVAVILLNANLYVWKIVRMWQFCGFRGEIDGADDDARGCKVSQCQGQRVRVKGISSGKLKTTRKVNEMQQFRMAGGKQYHAAGVS